MKRRKRDRRRSLAAPEPIEELIERAGENRFAKRKLPIPLAEWRAAVGPRIADRTRPYALDRGVLVVKVATSVWANELAMLAPELIARLRDRKIAVDSLRFRVGPLDMPEVPTHLKKYRKVPPPKPLTGEMATSLAKVGDLELRAAIESAARANLAWQDQLAVSDPERKPRSRR